MHILKRIFRPKNDSYLQATTLVMLVVVSWLAFYLAVVVTSLYGRNQCLYASWLPGGSWLSPYWMFVTLVSALMLFSIVIFINGVASSNRVDLIVGVVSVAFLALWLHGLHGLWRAMEYEQGRLTAEQWFSSQMLTDFEWYRESEFFQLCDQS